MQRGGILSLKDLLDKTSLYHPYTNTDAEGVFQRERAIKCINDKFHDIIRRNRKEECNEDTLASIIKWEELHSGGHIIKTKEGLHQELLEEYGGDYESSGEEYL